MFFVFEAVGKDDGVCLIRFSIDTEVHAPRVSFSKVELQR